MSGRLIDTILLALLAVILLAILVLAFGVGRPRPAEVAAPPAAIAPTAPALEGVQPLPPGGVQQPSPTASPAPPLAPTPTAPEPTTPPRPPLPAGEVALSRVSFAFANGVGACNIPLQPWQHVAVSPDLMATYGCGAAVRVTLAEPVAGRNTVTAVIADLMGPSMTGAINIFVAPDEPALQYGVVAGSLASP